jgi:NADH-quinone oxidoreductase subunit J
MVPVLFFILAAACAGSVLGMILSRDRTHGALFLVLAFAALGGIFGLLDAPFVAAVQVLVYAGAIMVLFLFVIMTVDPVEGRRPERTRGIGVPAVLLAFVLLVELLLALRGIVVAVGPSKAATTMTAGLGALLLGKRLYAFELASLLVVAALTGAVALAGKKDGR